MKKKNYRGAERRKFIRQEYLVPLAYKVCEKKTVSKLLDGYTADISKAGLLCNIKDKVKLRDLLWLSFNRQTLCICEGLEKRSLVYQSGVIGKVVRAQRKKDGTYNVGIQFVTREEKNLTNIYPKFHFLKEKMLSEMKEEEGDSEEQGWEEERQIQEEERQKFLEENENTER